MFDSTGDPRLQAHSVVMSTATDDQRKAAKHREIAARYARPRRKRGRPGIVSLILRDLSIYYRDKYGDTFPDDDAGRDDLVVLLHHMAQLGDPFTMRACAAHRCPWLTEAEYTAMIAAIDLKPRRWRADSLAQEIGLNRATRTRLAITTIGATDFCKAQRTKRRKNRNNAGKLADRAKAGAASHAASAERTKPWEALGISRRTYYRKLANGTVGTDSGTAARIYMRVPKQCHPNQKGASAQADLTRCTAAGLALNPALSTVCTVVAERVDPALATDHTKRDSAFAGRLGLHVIKKGKNPFDNYRLNALLKDMGAAA
jgi:hypothetical protein